MCVCETERARGERERTKRNAYLYPYILRFDFLHYGTKNAPQVLSGTHSEVFGHKEGRQRDTTEKISGNFLSFELSLHCPQNQLLTLAIAVKH